MDHNVCVCVCVCTFYYLFFLPVILNIFLSLFIQFSLRTAQKGPSFKIYASLGFLCDGSMGQAVSVPFHRWINGVAGRIPALPESRTR